MIEVPASDGARDPWRMARVLLTQAGVPPHNEGVQEPGDQYGLERVRYDRSAVEVTNRGVAHRLVAVRACDLEWLAGLARYATIGHDEARRARLARAATEAGRSDD